MKAVTEDLRAKKILIVDDDRFNQKMLALSLGRRGYLAVTALDGQQGYELALTEQPDLILMDLMMPRLDGYEATQLLKANPITRDIPIIALTAKVLPASEDKVLDPSFADYCTKPFHLQDLDAMIGRHLGTSV